MTKKLMSHNEANYRMTISLTRRCSLCSMYTPGRPPSCSLVVKPIDSGGVCDYFEKPSRSPQAKGSTHAA
jgi:hypothetical protein